MAETHPSKTPDAENKNLCMFDPAENVLPWTKQITLRAIVASVILSIVFNFIVMKLNLTTGVIPSLNVAAALIGFAMLKAYTALLRRFGWLHQPFSRQENTVIQTCVVASSGIAFSCGAGNYLLGMSATVAAQADEGNDLLNVKNLKLGWITAYLLLVSFVGLFSIMPLRKRMILKYKLTYPSGTATAHLINSFHTPKGTAKAKKQVSMLFKSFCGSFAFGFFKWFFAAGDNCGFGSFPTFGLQAYAQRFYFDFSTTYVGVGMICPYIVNVSMLLGAVLSWGIMWPLIAKKEGHWYQAGLASTSLHGIQGYRVFCAIAMILGDGLFQVVYMLVKTLPSLCKKDSDNNGAASNGQTVAVAPESLESQAAKLYEQRQVEYFLKDQIPDWLACLGYVLLAILSIICVPFIFPQLKWYHIIVVYVFAPILAFCNAYGCGLTDWSLASSYGKIAIICLSAWVGLGHGGIIAGLAGCGIMMNIVSTASDLMQDFKTGYLTLASPRSMFLSEVIGTAIGCVSSPLVFWVFYKAYSIGDPTGSYPAPYGLLYRGIALLGVQGLSSLPKHCLEISIGLFAFAILLNLVREILRAKECEVYKFIPSAMSMAIPFYLGGYFVIDMCIGSVILYVWRKVNKRQADEFHAALASGLICGESLWSIPAAVLSMAGLNAPICMKFLSSATNKKVDALLGA